MRDQLSKQPVGQLISNSLISDLQHVIFQIPWGHNVVIITNNWSRAVLDAKIESDLYRRKGTAIDNFNATLTFPQADLARETLKNPYNFEFLTIERKYMKGIWRVLWLPKFKSCYLNLVRDSYIWEGSIPFESAIQTFVP